MNKLFFFSLTADVQQRALLPPSAGLSNTSQNFNQDQTSDEDVLDDTDTDEENSKKQLQISNKKSTKSKPMNKSINDDSSSGAIQVKRLYNSIFPTTNDVYGFHLDEPSAESLECYEQYAKMARDACLLLTSSLLSPPPPTKQQYELSVPLNRSVSTTSSFEM